MPVRPNQCDSGVSAVPRRGLRSRDTYLRGGSLLSVNAAYLNVNSIMAQLRQDVSGIDIMAGANPGSD